MFILAIEFSLHHNKSCKLDLHFSTAINHFFQMWQDQSIKISIHKFCQVFKNHSKSRLWDTLNIISWHLTFILAFCEMRNLIYKKARAVCKSEPLRYMYYLYGVNTAHHSMSSYFNLISTHNAINPEAQAQWPLKLTHIKLHVFHCLHTQNKIGT